MIWEGGSRGLGLNLGDTRKRTFEMTPKGLVCTAEHVRARPMRETEAEPSLYVSMTSVTCESPRRQPSGPGTRLLSHIQRRALVSRCGRQMVNRVSSKCVEDSGKLQHRVLWKQPMDTDPCPECQGAWLPSRVWKDEQLAEQEEVREGKIIPDRKGGPVMAEPGSHRVWAGSKAIRCCMVPSARGGADRRAGEARSREAGQSKCSL